jgi:hypothetical protein
MNDHPIEREPSQTASQDVPGEAADHHQPSTYAPPKIFKIGTAAELLRGAGNAKADMPGRPGFVAG